MYKLVPTILRLNNCCLSSKTSLIQKTFFKKHIGRKSCFITSSLREYTTQVEPEQDGVLTNEQVESITKGDPELLQKLNVLMLEVQVLRQDGDHVPDHTNLKQEQWEQLLSLSSRSHRKKYLNFLWKIERKKENRLNKKDETKKAREEFIQARAGEDENQFDTNEYRLFGNTIFLRVYDTTVNQMYNNRLVQAMQFGQPLILDCSYSEHMTRRECLNTAKQLMLLFAANRAHDSPFDLHFCNSDFSGVIMKQLNKFIATMHEPWFPLSLHEDSYLNHFPKERLVYLTPHCRNDLEEFSHDDIYIIGAMVDKSNSEPISLAKAKQQGLRMARLPLDKHLAWSKSSKSLTLNQVCSILLDIKQTGDWDKSLVHVPRRKVMSDEELAQYGGKKQRYEKKSFFLQDRPLHYERKPFFSTDQSKSYEKGTFKKNFQNLDGYENFTNDLEPKRIQKRNFESNNFNRRDNYKANDGRNRSFRPDLKQVLEDD